MEYDCGTRPPAVGEFELIPITLRYAGLNFSINIAYY